MKNLYRRAARLYDLESMRDNLTDDIPFYIEYAKRQNGDVLELGCGTGRVAIPIAKEGFNVTGLDLSKEMLEVFKEKISSDETLSEKITLAHASMADFSLGKKFALIISPFRAFQLVTDDAEINATLACVRKHLTDGGLYIVNVFNPHGAMDESWRGGEEFDFEAVDERTGARVVRVSCKERIDPERQIIYPYLAYDVAYPDGQTERVVEPLAMKYYYAHQLRAVVEKAGLEILEEFSWYDKSPLGGREIIFVCGNGGRGI